MMVCCDRADVARFVHGLTSFGMADEDDDLLVANTNHSIGFGEFSEEEETGSSEEEEDDSEEDDDKQKEDADEVESDIDADDEQIRETARRLGNTVI